MPAAIASLVAVALGLLLLVYVLNRVDRVDGPGLVADRADILSVVAAEGGLRTDSWELEPSHRRPIDPYTPEQAHAVMQQHRECGTDICRAKHAAFWALADAGKLVDDGRVAR